MSIDHFRDTYAFLSNFYACEIEYEGFKYRTVEHAFQAAKCLDEESRKKLAEAKSPIVVKRLGRKVPLRKDWEEVKDGIMLQLLKSKFSKEPLRGKLKDTRPKELKEMNKWHDTYWGVCCCKKHNNQGKNILGKLLMEVRKEIQ